MTMNGTVLRPELLNEGARERNFLLRWREDAHAAFRELFQYKFPEFNYSGHGAEYWTPIGHLLSEKIIPESEYVTVAIAFMEASPLTYTTNHVYGDILQENVSVVSEWTLQHFDRLSDEIRELGEHPHRINTARSLYLYFVERIATAPGSSTRREFLQQEWYRNPSPVGAVWKSAFRVNGRYGEDADRAILWFIRRCRRGLRIVQDEFDGYRQKYRHLHSFAEEQLRREEYLRDEVEMLLMERYGWYKTSAPLWKADPKPTAEAEAQIRSKLE